MLLVQTEFKGNKTYPICTKTVETGNVSPSQWQPSSYMYKIKIKIDIQITILIPERKLQSNENYRNEMN